MKGSYKTRQSSIILSYLQAEHGHVTAASLTAHLREKGEAIGTATVYRQLDKLVDMGLVRKYITDKGACYQYAGNGCDEHFHLKCTQCDTLFHVDCSFLSDLAPHILAHHGFTVDNRRTVMYGLCAKCKNAVTGGDFSD